MCGGTLSSPGDCSQYVCANWLDGVEVPTYAWSPSGPWAQNEHAANSLKAAAATVNDPRGVAALLLKLHQQLYSYAPAMYLPSKSKKSLLAASVKNAYSSSGYNALAVGCASGLNCPSASTSGTPGMAGWLIALLCIIGLCVSASVAFYFYRAHQMARADSAFLRLAEGQSKATHGATETI